MPLEILDVPFTREVVYDVLERSLASAFNVSINDLPGASIMNEREYAGKKIQLQQKVLTVDAPRCLSFETINHQDSIVTTYVLDEEGESTRIRLSEEVSSNKLSRRWSYFLFDLPIISGFARKRLRRQLEALRNAIEEII